MSALYIHWPFCASKCPYCDFNSHVRRGSLDVEAWQRALTDDIVRTAHDFPFDEPLGSIFFGGGTPSLMPPSIVAACLQTAERVYGFADTIEITLEANPTSAEAGRFADYRAAGVNRLSLGVQSLHDAALRDLGRTYTADEARVAIDIAHACFARVSCDYIYARTDHRLQPDAWADELRTALSLTGDHVSLYQLTLEPGTRFTELYRRGKLHMPSDDTAAHLYALTEQITREAGFDAYETSNYARPGGQSQHNLVYWRYGLYAGVGPGACSRLRTREGVFVAGDAVRAPEAWLEATLSDGARAVFEPLTHDERMREFLLMGIRLREGLDAERFGDLFGRELPIPDDLQPFLQRDEARIRLTSDGIPVADAVLRAWVGALRL